MRTRFVDSPSAFENAVEGYVQRGYDVTAKTETRAVCEANDYGSWKIHLVLLIFTVGFGNVPYALYRALTADKVEVKVRAGVEEGSGHE